MPSVVIRFVAFVSVQSSEERFFFRRPIQPMTGIFPVMFAMQRNNLASTSETRNTGMIPGIIMIQCFGNRSKTTAKANICGKKILLKMVSVADLMYPDE